MGYTMIEYKGYLGLIDFDPESDSFHETIINIKDVITFYGSSVTELRQEMKRSIEVYLAFCREQGREPEAPCSGKQIIQTSPDLHRRIALNAARRRINLNTYYRRNLRTGCCNGIADCTATR